MSIHDAIGPYSIHAMKLSMENIPPKIFKRYGGEILEIKEGESCVVQFDVKEEDYNPLGVI